MHDRFSRPHHSPRRTPAPVEQQVVRLRREHRIGPVRLAARTGIAASTAHRILVRHGLPGLAACDHDPNWPTEAEGVAVRALRGFRDALIRTIPAPEPEADQQTTLHARQDTSCTVRLDTL